MRSSVLPLVGLLACVSRSPRVASDGVRAETAIGDSQDARPVVHDELRGVWITRFSWAEEEELLGMLDHVSAVGFNAVFFQVRGNFDAYYASELEPWAQKLTGELGKDPGWDPLAEVIQHGHALGLEVHAYVNTYPLWRGAEAPASVGVPHPLSLHPDWVVVNEAGEEMALNDLYIYASPGHPEVRAHVAEVAIDITQRYDIDGLHLDYIRYPGAQYSHDSASLTAFGDSGSPDSWAEWKVAQPGLLLDRIRAEVRVPVSAAVWGIHTDRFGWGGVSEGLADYHQDSHAWLSEGRLDAAAPMIYWGLTDTPGERLDFSTLLEDHMVHSSGRHIYAGIGGEALSMDAVIECIEESRRQGAAGTILFDYSLFADELYRLGAGVYAEPASPPSMPWRTDSGVGSRP